MMETKTAHFFVPAQAVGWINDHEQMGWTVVQVVPLTFGPSGALRSELMIVLERPKSHET